MACPSVAPGPGDPCIGPLSATSKPSCDDDECDLLAMYLEGPNPAKWAAKWAKAANVSGGSDNNSVAALRTETHEPFWMQPLAWAPKKYQILSNEENVLLQEQERKETQKHEQQRKERNAHNQRTEDNMQQWEDEYDAKRLKALHDEIIKERPRHRSRPPVPLFDSSQHTAVAVLPSTAPQVQVINDSGTPWRRNRDMAIVHKNIVARAGKVLQHCINIIDTLLAHGNNLRIAYASSYFKIGITEDLERRCFSAECGGYVHDKSIKWRTMVVLHETTAESRAEAPMLEAALIHNYKHLSHCMNNARVSPGGEGWSLKRGTAMYVYFVTIHNSEMVV